MHTVPRVGVAVIVKKDNKILLHIRKNSHGDGTWSMPGGHLELNEELKECANRETFEEAGIKLKNLRFVAITNDVFHNEKKHYVTIFMLADYDSGEPEVKEPDKCECWEWHSWNELPRPLFSPIENLLKQGFNPFK